MTDMTAPQCEAALDSGKLQVRAQNGRWYDCRRNGATKRWKRDAGRYEIPIKVGFRDAYRVEFFDGIHQSTCFTLRVRPDDFSYVSRK